MPASDLDGTYQITTVTNYEGPLERKSDGLTEIRDGITTRRDGNNVLWTSTFEILNNKQVRMKSLADPTEAKDDFALTKPDGTPSREPTEYETILRYARKDDKIQMSGQIEYGNEIIFITMRRVGE